MKNLSLLALVIFIFLAISSGFGEEPGFVYDPKGKRDPFIPAELAQKEKLQIKGRIEDIRLEGILWDRRGDSFAIINDEILKAGDTIMGFKILKIEKDRIIFSSGEDSYSIRMDYVKTRGEE